MAGAYSLFDYISPGHHVDAHGKLDERIWFIIPVGQDDIKGTITYLKFPMGAKSHEIIEEEVDLPAWID